MFRFQAASLVPRASFHSDVTAGLAHAVRGASAVMSFQGGEGPVRVGHHMDAALRGDQNSDIARVRRLGSGFGRFQDRFGVVEECPHTELIGTGSRVFGKIWLLVAQSFVGIDACGAKGREQAGQQRDSGQEQRNAAKSCRVKWADAVEHAGENL